MDEARFDALARTIADAGATRRGVVRSALAGLGGVVLGGAPFAGGRAKKKKKKKKCKGGKKKCGKTCCPVGQFCNRSRCSPCPPPLFACPEGGCVRALCGGGCCAVADTCADGQCVPCPVVADGCADQVPRCGNGSGVCRTSVEGGNFCTDPGASCLPQACTANDECEPLVGFGAVCFGCSGCGGDNACAVRLPE